jgi:hypothetical protein
MKRHRLLKILGTLAIIGSLVATTILPVSATTKNHNPELTHVSYAPATVTTDAADYTYLYSNGNRTATFNATVDLGTQTSVYLYFEYGLTVAYGKVTARRPIRANGTYSKRVLTDIVAGVDYHYRAVIKYGTTTVTGADEVANLAVVAPGSGAIASGEIRGAAGSLTEGNANAICFAWHNPEVSDVFISKVVIEITTPGGTALSVLKVGIADDATGTNLGNEYFTGIDLNTAAITDSWADGDTGVQTKLVVLQDSASATDGWVVGKILTQNAASLVGKYYIFYVGR